MWTLHLVQGPAGVENPGPSSTEYLHDRGHLDDRLLAGHCVGLSPRDIQLLRAADVKGCTQVVSNCFLAMGMAPVPELLEAGVTLAMGTDDVNCNGSVKRADVILIDLGHAQTTLYVEVAIASRQVAYS